MLSGGGHGEGRCGGGGVFVDAEWRTRMCAREKKMERRVKKATDPLYVARVAAAAAVVRAKRRLCESRETET